MTRGQVQQFKVSVVLNGFMFTGKSADGSVEWYRSRQEIGFRRICIDGLTQSLTIFWQNVPSPSHEIHTEKDTFRTRREFEGWLATHPLPVPPIEPAAVGRCA